MTEVGNRIKLSEIKRIRSRDELEEMIRDVFRQGLEGLMIKDMKSVYEPGKRHWLKVGYEISMSDLFEGCMDRTILVGYISC